MRGTKTVVLNEKKGEKMKTKTQTRCAAGLEYTLEIKAVKRLNLRLRRDGSIALSVPPGTPAAVADDFVQRKADWLRTARQRVLAREQALQRRQPPTRGECAAVFARADAKIWPLFRQALGQDIRLAVGGLHAPHGNPLGGVQPRPVPHHVEHLAGPGAHGGGGVCAAP